MSIERLSSVVSGMSLGCVSGSQETEVLQKPSQPDPKVSNFHAEAAKPRPKWESIYNLKLDSDSDSDSDSECTQTRSKQVDNKRKNLMAVNVTGLSTPVALAVLVGHIETRYGPSRAGGDLDFHTPNNMRRGIAKALETEYQPQPLPKNNIACIVEVIKIAEKELKYCEEYEKMCIARGCDTTKIKSSQKDIKSALNVYDQIKKHHEQIS
ncbi:MAG: hypothetical protein HAW66_01940 [Shewanella sp.]|nr:hypothetical protein [Shewanella sp.]